VTPRAQSVRAQRGAALEAFTSCGPFPFAMLRRQRVANAVSAAALIGVAMLAACGFGGLIRAARLARPDPSGRRRRE